MKKWKKIILVLLSILLVIIIGFFVYVSDYYRSVSDEVDSILLKENITVSNSVTTIKNQNSNTGFIFYPGGKVEAKAYLPLLDKICSTSVNCYLVEMPFNLAVFDTNAAKSIIDSNPDISNWYIGGHSLGGVMASKFYADHPEELKGLVLLGSYIYGDLPPNETLTVYGSNDLVLDRSKITYTDNVYEIEGGNHAGFGNYGEQKGDGPLDNPLQQDITADLIRKFMGFKSVEIE